MQRIASIDIYSLDTKQWLTDKSLPQLNYARQSHSSCGLGGYVYVFGGDIGSIQLVAGLERVWIGPTT